MFSPDVHTLPRSAATSDRTVQRRLAMLALKQSGRSTPDVQSSAEFPGFNGMYLGKPRSKSEITEESYVRPEIEQPEDMVAYPSMQRWLRSSTSRLHSSQLESGGNSSSSATDHHWAHTLPRQRSEWVGQGGPKSDSRGYNIRDGYATWSGRRRAATGQTTGSGSQGLDEAERGFGEPQPLNPAFEDLSRRRRVAQKETSSDSDSPPANSRLRERRRSPPKFRQQFDEQLKAAASKPTTVLVKKVTLRRKSSVSDFGFSVADSVTDSGVFVKAVRPSGPAEEKLKPFDKILQVCSNEFELQILDDVTCC